MQGHAGAASYCWPSSSGSRLVPWSSASTNAADCTTAITRRTTMKPISYRTVLVDGLTVFYREAGEKQAHTLVLLHGFPSSSHMFRNLLPVLSDNYSCRCWRLDLPVPQWRWSDGQLLRM